MRSDANVSALVNTKAASELMGVAPGTLENWRTQGIGPKFIKTSRGRRGLVFYDTADIEAWKNANRFQSTSEITTEKIFGPITSRSRQSASRDEIHSAIMDERARCTLIAIEQVKLFPNNPSAVATASAIAKKIRSGR